ncbi:MAG: M23 family metallopeptidase [Candidatus Krumholzibacteriia bacterium]
MSSRFTRIILMTDDDRGLREFTISHTMVWVLGVLGLLLAGLLLYIFLSYGELLGEARQTRRLAAELDRTRAEVAAVDTLQAELRAMGAMQQQLLTMLGIETAPVDTGLGDGHQPDADPLSRLADVVMTRPPDAWPAAGFITQEFTEGEVHRGERPHLGLDIAGPEGEPILAAGDGLVVRTGTDPFLGNFVEIQHGMGYLTVYGHCRQVAVARGAEVRRGQIVAYMGATGEASAPHLHFEVWQHGMAVDPRRFLQGEPPQP